MFCIQIAEVLIAIKNRYAFTERLCADYIVDTSPDDCDISIAATPEEIAAENDEKGSFSPAYCESLALYRKICTRMLDFNAFLFHAAIISYAEQGFAFTAKSGTGKSTHIAQWVRALGEHVTVVNGDKPILRWRTGKLPSLQMGRPAGKAHVLVPLPLCPLVGKESKPPATSRWVSSSRTALHTAARKTGDKTRAFPFAPFALSSAASRTSRTACPVWKMTGKSSRAS